MSTKPELKPLTEQTLQNLHAVTGDPIDAMRLAADIYATNAYLAERARAIVTGQPRPEPPEPQSTFVRSLVLEVGARLVEIDKRLTGRERSRLRAVGVAIDGRPEGETGLVAILLLLTVMHPADAASWIRGHLDEIEKRVAS
jgi:hypothetical protein